MKKAILLISLFFFAVTAPSIRAQTNPVPPQIQNLRASQRPGTMLVDITYDLIDPDSTNMYVLLECSSTGGSTYGVPIATLTGDIDRVTPGTGKKIVWDAWKDWAGNFTTNAKIQLSADDSASTVVPPTPPSAAPTTNLVWIPSGSFKMSHCGGSGDANVHISRGFWMGKYEVTQAEYVSIMTNNPRPL